MQMGRAADGPDGKESPLNAGSGLVHQARIALFKRMQTVYKWQAARRSQSGDGGGSSLCLGLFTGL